MIPSAISTNQISPPATPSPRRLRHSRRSASTSGIYPQQSPSHHESRHSHSQSQSYSPSPQRFSRLFNTVLGSPFLTTSDPDYLPPDLDLIDGSPTAVPRTFTVTRPSSPTPTADFSIIGHDEFDGQPPDVFSAYGSFPSRRGFNPRASRFYSTLSPSLSSPCIPPTGSSYPPTNSSPLRSLLPKLWDALSSPGRGVLHLSNPNSNLNTLPSRSASPLRGKGKGRVPSSASSPFLQARWSGPDNVESSADFIDYTDLAPLDGEEGELIDDEACFIDVRAVTGIDILTLLPTELALQIISLLNTADDLANVIACLSVSKAWHTLANDNSVWRALFLGRWGIDLRKAKAKKGLRERGMDLVDLEHPGGQPAVQKENNRSQRYGNLAPRFHLPTSPPRILHLPSHSQKLRRRAEIDWKKRSFSVGTSLSSPPSPSTSARPPSLTSMGVWKERSSATVPRSPTRPPLFRVPSRKRRASTSSVGTVHTILPPPTRAPLTVDWRFLYRERFELDRRWAGTARVPQATPSPSPLTNLFPVDDRLVSIPASPFPTPSARFSSAAPGSLLKAHDNWEPKVMRISGHSDSVYCLEFDSTRIITGSRDRTIKIWSLKTGKLLGTVWGVHRGSVLCLKFESDWEDQADEEDEDDVIEPVTEDQNDTDGSSGDESIPHGSHRTQRVVQVERHEPSPDTEGNLRKGKRGFMVTGSSDCNVCVWDLYTISPAANIDGDAPTFIAVSGEAVKEVEQEDKEVRADLRAVLKGHSGGVLDLRIDKKWIVSCSKDAVIRIWNRRTLTLHRTLRGHEGPVNAVGLQENKVVSASGDGKMILWDIASGERLRTFEGHDRGLACIEFKNDFIVSGSNDCKIKVWSATTGECLKTLVGHEALVRALSFDPKSKRLVSASYDKSVKLWDLNTGKMVREFKNTHTSHIFDVKFDVARIVSTSHDQKIVVLDFSYGLDASLFV
ncbi:WD40 repeat-like protein [Pluteus cervinus]|uniref:WD40 repeat-like protein n=1 Tax=Pluteus cervinus TaxID=181527 RepID=A0ACD3BBZ7_9AGAR|nr:WD40 repeat-like protein [Pluteus cervinus]